MSTLSPKRTFLLLLLLLFLKTTGFCIFVLMGDVNVAGLLIVVAVVTLCDAQVDKDDTEDEVDIAHNDDAEERASVLLVLRRRLG